jgi:Tol biopolymer transport system component
MATPFTPEHERVTEGGTPLVENILVLSAAAVAVFSPSATGMLIFQTGASAEASNMIYWTDIENGGMQSIGEPGQIFHPAVSPDGTRAIVEVHNASNEGTDLWLVDLDTGLRTRFTFAPGDETRPIWSRSGEFVFYESQESGAFRIVQQPVEGQGGAAIILESDREIAPTSAGLEDRDLLVDYEREDGNFDMRRLSLAAGDDELVTVAGVTDAMLGGGKYSPDGRWIAYHTQSAAGWDVFVMPATGGARKWQITADGGVYPRWNHYGTELWVVLFNGDLRTYAVDGNGQTFRAGNFSQPLTITPPEASGSFYDLHPDGLRILQTGTDPAYRAEVSYLHLVTDWRSGLVQ